MSLDELFSTFTADADGTIAEADLKQYLQSSARIQCSQASLEDYMHALDTDMTGRINREEFTVFMEAARAVIYPEKVNEIFEHHEVFLGGSCNPTTWRKDLAIPMLNRAGVTFYNPQVDDWHEGLIALEAKAKAQAPVLLFVIDKHTRALSSMVEVAELIAVGRKTITVIQDIDENDLVAGERISGSQLKDLNRCRAYLADVVMRHGRLETGIVYKNISKALQACVKMVKSLRHFPERPAIEEHGETELRLRRRRTVAGF